ncbi:hypothetical protein L4174_023820 (plasmid) [Photobacterium sp. CCB-ST2H9]|uniref:hypothetical protein n=1 Tax=Photobacterium sp. CCB-ST2H9 TaxID=2912855 RepID=UPI002003A2EB|nr:hypothetical protein [Photobacterium sp. CCB-ST2H9]UTM60415.1 hypothetical protein L4174_023820 [Photobacterium sp. CCB-ST2H9]
MSRIIGVPHDDGISDAFKVSITQNMGKAGHVTVVGYLTEGSSVALSSIWESPFQGDHIGAIQALDKAVKVYQWQSSETLKTQANSASIWEGTEPPQIPLALYFHAYTDAKKQVNDPLTVLKQMASPELAEVVPVSLDDAIIGREPQDAIFDIGRRIKIKMRIHDVQYDLNLPKTNDGYFAYQTVTLTASPKGMINRSQIPQYFT